MSAPSPAPAISPEALSAWWGVLPAGIARGGRSGFTAARWLLAGDARELRADSDMGTHVLSVMLRGSAHARLRLNDQEVLCGRVGTGDLVLIPAGHIAVAQIEDYNVDFLDLYLPAALLHEAVEQDGIAPSRVELALPVHARDPEIDALARRVAAEIEQPGAASMMLLDGLALELVALLVRRWSNLSLRPDRVRGGLVPFHLRRVTEYLLSRLQEDVSLEEAAGVTGLSTKHFARAFRQSTGLAPHQWLIHQRVERAKAMLGSGEHGLADIALACGFADQSHFTATFRRTTGMTPGAWRRERA